MYERYVLASDRRGGRYLFTREMWWRWDLQEDPAYQRFKPLSAHRARVALDALTAGDDALLWRIYGVSIAGIPSPALMRTDLLRAMQKHLFDVPGFPEQPGPGSRLVVFKEEIAWPKSPAAPEEIALPEEPPALSDNRAWVAVECVDADDKPVPRVKVRVTTRAGFFHEAFTDHDGLVRVSSIAPGGVTITLLELDAQLWQPAEGPPASTYDEDSFHWHKVRPGDCLSKISHQYGLKYWQDIWKFRLNQALREKRKSPHVLYPGEDVAVPKPRLGALARETHATHRIVVKPRRVRRGYVLAAQDLRFHPHSGVLLAQSTPPNDAAVRSDAPGLDALATTLLHARENRGRTLLLAGHSDAAETPEGDRTLSEARAAAVRHLLRGDRQAWVALVQEHSCREDLPAILRWCAEARGWACAPAEAEPPDADEARALKAFQEAYNQSHGASIAEDGVLGPETWGALFEVYQDQLALALETDAAGLGALQSSLQFCAAAESYGCGDVQAAHAGSSAEDARFRRTDVRFFEPGEEPSPHDLEQGLLTEPDFSFTPFAPHQTRPTWATLQVSEIRLDGSVVSPAGKHIYVASECEIVAVACGRESGIWGVQQRESQQVSAAQGASLRVAPHRLYQVLLSPFALTRRAEQRFAQNADRCKYAGRVEAGEAGSHVRVETYDVTARITELHEAYMPAVERVQAWLQDEEEQSRARLASALIAFKQQDPSIAEVLGDKSEATLEEYDQKTLEIRKAAESYAIELALAFESEEYLILETSASEELGESMDYMMMHLAVNLSAITFTEPGRHFAWNLVGDEERIPAQFLFTDKERPEVFQPGRRFALWAQAMFTWLAPVAALRLNRSTTEANAAALEAKHAPSPKLGPARDILRQYFEQLSGVTHTDAQRLVADLVEHSDTQWTPKHPLWRDYWDLLLLAEEQRQVVNQQSAEELARALEAHTDDARKLRGLAAQLPGTLGFATVFIETVNAMQVIAKTDTKAPFKATLGMASALADVSAATLDTAETLLKQAGKQVSKTLAKRVHIAAAISGALDCVSFSMDAGQAVDKGQYDQVAGNVLAAAGGGVVGYVGLVELAGVLVAAGSESTVAAVAAGGLFGISPLLVAGVAAAMLVGGVVWVAFSERGPFKLFAQFSSFGNDHEKEPQGFAWSPLPLPAKSLCERRSRGARATRVLQARRERRRARQALPRGHAAGRCHRGAGRGKQRVGDLLEPLRDRCGG